MKYETLNTVVAEAKQFSVRFYRQLVYRIIPGEPPGCMLKLTCEICFCFREYSGDLAGYAAVGKYEH